MRALLACLLLIACATPSLAQPIDRQALVARHCPTYDHPHPRAPLQVGNGQLAFAMDITGLQSLPSAPGETPRGCMAQWAWHAFAQSKDYAYEQTLVPYKVHGRQVTYATDRYSEAAQVIRENPHRFNLAKIGLRRGDGRTLTATDIVRPQQTLNLWTGEVTSHFLLDGHPVVVHTVAHPTADAIAVSVKSPLLLHERNLALELAFAYPAGVWGPGVDAWDQPDKHQTQLETQPGESLRVFRTLDKTLYTVDVDTSGTLEPTVKPHVLRIDYAARKGLASELQACFWFRPGHQAASHALSFAQVRQAAAEHWSKFWSTGGAIDLAGSTDARWRELERRIVLSQYQTAINCAGTMPPQETGLVCNSWFGKSHLEMHWWHAAHFAQWGRLELLERSLAWYDQILPAARRIARRQGYAGARWPKMTGPQGVSSPSDVGELLIWQQPHPIYFAQQVYRQRPSEATLKRYDAMVRETADFMADYAHWDADAQHYSLGPVLIPAQECYDGRTSPGVMNPTFELAYWRWALQVACDWQVRMGRQPKAKWIEVADKIARPHQQAGIYTAIANAPFTRRHDHPSMLGALGVLPEVGLTDPQTMRRTLHDVLADWDWAETWGWDYPMMAMTAARLGDADLAVDLLLKETPKNHYLPNGHCWQSQRLPLYLPANGGLLMATAMMAAGWDHAPAEAPAPGFPSTGGWHVRHEGLHPIP